MWQMAQVAATKGDNGLVFLFHKIFSVITLGGVTLVLQYFYFYFFLEIIQVYEKFYSCYKA